MGKITTSVDSIVRDILNYDSSKDNENELIAKIAVYAMLKLSSEFNIEKGDLHIDKSSNMGTSRGSYVNESIKIDEGSFSDKALFGRNMMTVFHETYHYAEDMGRLADGVRFVSNKSHSRNNKFIQLMNKVYGRKGLYKDIFNPVTAFIQKLTHNSADDYIGVRYELNQSEYNARQFALDTLKEVIDYAEEKGLADNPNAQLALLNLQKVYITEEREECKCNKYAESLLKKNDKFYRNIIEQIYTKFTTGTEKEPSVLEKLKLMTHEDYKKFVKENGDVLDELNTCLSVHYDEAFANKFVDTLLSMDDEIYANDGSETLLRMFITSNYEPTDEQLSKIRERSELNPYSYKIICERLEDNIIVRD